MALLVEGGVGGDGEMGIVEWVRGQDGGREEVCKMRQVVCYLDFAGFNCRVNGDGRWCGWDQRGRGRSSFLASAFERWWAYDPPLY